MFYNRYISAAIENLFVNNGLYQPSYTLNGNVAAQVGAGPLFPSVPYRYAERFRNRERELRRFELAQCLFRAGDWGRLSGRSLATRA